MQKKAFLFSAGNYEKTDRFCITDLSGVKYDITAMKKRLQQIKFDVVSKEDIKKHELIDTLQNETESLHSDSISIVYFTGHGGHCDGKNYIFPSDFSTLFENNLSVSEAGIDINEIISFFHNKGRLILILDSCRTTIGQQISNHYSEMTIAENVYIAYGTMFQHKSVGINMGLSWFTEAICDEILTANIDINTLFTNVRNNLYRKHHTLQVSISVDGLLEPIYLHKEENIDISDQQVYEFIKTYGDEYCDKYGYFHGDDLIFIDAAQYFNISFLDACWKFMKVDNKCFKDKGVNIPELSEDEQKIVTFLGLHKGEKFFTYDKCHTWYYNGRQIRMGEIPPLPSSMQRMLPEPGKALAISITSEKKDDKIIISINLPNECMIHISDNIHKISRTFEVIDKQIRIENASDISFIHISSPVYTKNNDNDVILGRKHRNLSGRYIEYDPIFGNKIVYHKEF